MPRFFIALAVGAATTATATATATAAPARIHHAVDPRAVDPELTVGAKVVIGPVTKSAKNPLFVEDKPWEGANRNTYPTATFDPSDKMYKLWYNSNTRCPTGSAPGMCPHLGYPKEWLPALMGAHATGTLYAESKDGLTFVKPSLGIVEWNGSTANNIVLDADSNDYNRGVFMDTHEKNASRRFKLFGGVNIPYVKPPGSTLHSAVSKDGKHWTDLTSAASMDVAGDTANNALWDADLGTYLAFSRRHCGTESCKLKEEGDRRETISRSKTFLGGWSNATECAHGEGGYELYSIAPFRTASWAAGLYFGVGSFYATAKPEGRVFCELMTSADHGSSWTRLAPHKEFIPHSADGSGAANWDSHTCYSANGVVSGETTRFYYAGGNGPHSGGGREHGRRNGIGLATAHTDGLAGLASASEAQAAAVWSRPVAVGAGLWVLVPPTACDGLRVGVFPSAGVEAAIEGFAHGACVPAEAAAQSPEHPQWHAVSWPGRSLATLGGAAASLRFEVARGALSAFGF